MCFESNIISHLMTHVSPIFWYLPVILKKTENKNLRPCYPFTLQSTTDNVQFVSLRTHGLGSNDHRVRRDVLHHLRQKKCSIMCVQDTHLTKDIKKRSPCRVGKCSVFQLLFFSIKGSGSLHKQQL